MIETFRQTYMENPAALEKYLSNAEDANRYKRFAHEIHQTLIRTRRMLQDFLDMIEALPSGNVRLDYQRLGTAKRAQKEKQIGDLVSFFIGIQKATSTIVKGGFHLSRQGVLQQLTPDDLAAATDWVLEEGKRLAVYCESQGIPCFDIEFLKKVLTTLGCEGFKTMVESEEYMVLRVKPNLFYQAMIHQQGPEPFLQSKLHAVQAGLQGLNAKGEFDDLAADDPGILARAVLNYHSAKTSRGKKFSNAHDYLLFLREQKNKDAEQKKKSRRKRAAPEVY